MSNSGGFWKQAKKDADKKERSVDNQIYFENNKTYSPNSTKLIAFGERIRKERVRRRLTQEQLAVEAGVSKSTMSYIENGQEEIKLGTFDKLSTALDTSTDYLLGKSKEAISSEEIEFIYKLRGLNEAQRNSVIFEIDQYYELNNK